MAHSLKDLAVTIRQQLEEREQQTLAPHACLSSESRGRLRPEPPCPLRTAFQHDRDRILHSKAFRRLKHKTQVFLAPEGDHYRTRLTHTLEVAQIARTVARALALNEDLTEAIALGHDLGHTPFGHAGERILHELAPEGFHHVRQSLRVVDRLEKEGDGLNLCEEVRDGILKHSKGLGPLTGFRPDHLPFTREGQIVRLADVIAYVNHDLDDALRSGLIAATALPESLLAPLGQRHSERINSMVRDLIETSVASADLTIALSPPILEAVETLRGWLYTHVYRCATVEDDFQKAARVIRELFNYFLKNEEALLRCGGVRPPDDTIETAVTDFIAGMTDRYALNLYHQLFLPQPWKNIQTP
ncbi:MAG: deoxyguanosinetriphosphate triphosphohydrolase [Desulfuromonas sp.]|nr:MAG: deoxyguanosinetriphosphate triphosphohydrolase [Desulfuromonas sp.]